jgi:uncharacterized protein
MERRKLAQLILSDLAAEPGEPYPLDRIRMQKAVFLLVQRGKSDWRTLYRFEPYNWGPYSSQLASDIRGLVREGLLEIEQAPGSRYGRYRTTHRGEMEARTAWEGLGTPEREFIRSVRAYVTHKSFTQLLREVYAAYPDFATASRFTG